MVGPLTIVAVAVQGGSFEKRDASSEVVEVRIRATTAHPNSTLQTGIADNRSGAQMAMASTRSLSPAKASLVQRFDALAGSDEVLPRARHCE